MNKLMLAMFIAATVLFAPIAMAQEDAVVDEINYNDQSGFNLVVPNEEVPDPSGDMSAALYATELEAEIEQNVALNPNPAPGEEVKSSLTEIADVRSGFTALVNVRSDDGTASGLSEVGVGLKTNQGALQSGSDLATKQVLDAGVVTDSQVAADGATGSTAIALSGADNQATQTVDHTGSGSSVIDMAGRVSSTATAGAIASGGGGDNFAFTSAMATAGLNQTINGKLEGNNLVVDWNMIGQVSADTIAANAIESASLIQSMNLSATLTGDKANGDFKLLEEGNSTESLIQNINMDLFFAGDNGEAKITVDKSGIAPQTGGFTFLRVGGAGSGNKLTIDLSGIKSGTSSISSAIDFAAGADKNKFKIYGSAPAAWTISDYGIGNRVKFFNK